MNLATSQTPHPDVYQEALNHVGIVKESFGRTWHDMQHSVELFSKVIHQQARRIQDLETQASDFQNDLNDKTALAETLGAKITELTKSYDSQLAQKQSHLAEAARRIAVLLENAKQGNTRIDELRVDAAMKEERYQNVSAQVEVLQQQLRDRKSAEEVNGSQIGRDVDFERKMADIEGALKKELESRSDAVRRAAAAVAKEAAEVNVALSQSYHESQARVAALEEQLRTSRGAVSKMTKLHFSKSPLVTFPARTSDGTTIPHRIVSGIYRPKPPPPPQNQSIITIPPALPVASGIGSNPPVAASSSNTPAPLSINTSSGHAQRSGREVIDLTSPIEGQDDAIPPAMHRDAEEGLKPIVSTLSLDRTRDDDDAKRAQDGMSQALDQRYS